VATIDDVFNLLKAVNEVTLKRFYKEGSKVRLQPANSAMEPRIVEADRCRIQGVVIGVLRSYN